MTYRKLSYEDLKSLLNLMSRLVDKWEILAVHLPNMTEKSIGIVRAMPGDADVKLFEIMKRWLNEAHPAPTVKDLTDALKSDFLSEHRVARAIEEEFRHKLSSK